MSKFNSINRSWRFSQGSEKGSARSGKGSGKVLEGSRRGSRTPRTPENAHSNAQNPGIIEYQENVGERFRSWNHWKNKIIPAACMVTGVAAAAMPAQYTAGAVVLASAAAGIVWEVLAHRKKNVASLQGTEVDRAINAVYHGGEYRSLDRWADGGHAQTAAACRQGLQGEVHENAIETIGKMSFCVGYENGVKDRDTTVDYIDGLYRAELAKHNAAKNKIVKALLPVVGKDNIAPAALTANNYQLAEELSLELLSMYNAQTGEQENADDLQSTVAAMKAARDRWKRKFEEAAETIDQLTEQLTAEQESTGPIPDNVLQMPRPEATPKAVYEYHESGNSWAETAAYFGLSGKGRACTLAKQYTPGMEVSAL